MFSAMPSELFVCGLLSDVRKGRDVQELLIGGQSFALYDEAAGALLSRGAYVRVLARANPHQERYDAVVLQVEGYDPRYVGHVVSWPALVLAMLLLGIGFRALNPVIYGLGVGIAGVYVWFLWRRLFDFESFATHAVRTEAAAENAARSWLPRSSVEYSALPNRLVVLESLDFSHDSLMGWDLESGAIVHWSQGASVLYDCARMNALSKVRADLPRAWECGDEAVLDQLRAERTWVGEVSRGRPDGSEMRIHTRLAILSCPESKPIVVEMSWISGTHGNAGWHEVLGSFR